MQSIVVALALVLTLSAVGCKPAPSTPPETSEEKTPLPSGEIQELITTTSIVQAIDQQTRMVTLKRADGAVVTFRASKDVVNLPQVEVGDEVTVEYYESLAYQVKKAGEATKENAVEDTTALAPVGAKPGGEEVRVTTLTATIDSIDKSAGTVTLKDPAGGLTTVKARDPKNLELVDVGDLVEITITEALAISVTAPTK
jgi:hypothetical protein